MPNHIHDLSLSQTFTVVNGQFSVEDSVEHSIAPSADAAAKIIAGRTGAVIDSKYKVLALLGEGGMGVVYRVLHLQLDKEFALKTFRTLNLSPEAWERFQREARAIAKLSHPNIVQVFDFGIGDQNFPYYTMESLVGESLSERLGRSGALPIDEALSIFIAVAGGLAHAHRQGIVHRDIKPSNIFMVRSTAGTTPKIVDFGLAKLVTSERQDSHSPDFRHQEKQRLTGVGMVFGSPLYMSPEQGSGLDTDQRTDIYSFGCSLFQALTGKPPFVGENALATILMHQNLEPPSLVQASGSDAFPRRLEVIVAKLLAKDADKRYQSCDEVMQELSLVGKSNIRKTRAIAGSKKKSSVGAGQDEEGEAAEPDIQGAPKTARNVLKRYALAALALALTLAAAAVCVLVFSSQDSVQPKAASKILSGKTADRATQFQIPEDTAPDTWRLDGEKGFRPIDETFVAPEGKPWILKAGTRFYTHPEMFRRLQSDQLTILSLNPNCVWKSRHLAAIANLKALRELTLTDIPLEPSDLQYVNKLHHLERLRVSNTTLPGKELARLSRLGQLKYLYADNLKDLGLLLDQLQNSQELFFLSVKGGKLKDDDLKKISKIPKLAELNIDRNPLITPTGLESLAALPELKKLSLRGDQKLGPPVTEVLHRFRHLTNLSIDTAHWTQTERDRLARTLPKGCTLEE